MPLRPPSRSSANTATLRTDITYEGTLIDLDERDYQGSPRYNANGDLVTSPSIIWKFELVDDEGNLVVREDGSPFEQWGFSSDSTFLDTKGGSRTAKARLYMHALAGRDLTDDEVDDLIRESSDGLPRQLIGRKVLVELKTYTGQDGSQKFGIDRLKPLPQRRPAPATPPPQPQRRAVLGRRNEESDVPF